MNRYKVAIQDNVNSLFETTLPQVNTFSIFDIADLLNESDPGFENYGQGDLKIISSYFYGTNKEAKLLPMGEFQV